MGRAAATHVVSLLSRLLSEKGSARVIFACAPSQDQFLEALLPLAAGHIDWRRVTAFHMDEYVGLSAAHPASFRNYLNSHLLSKISVGQFHAIQGEAPDPSVECARYAALIDAAPIDLICLGIGENGHLAFNDPPVANFNDSHSAKIVDLDPICRQQQVNDGCFGSLDEVPKKAITLTLPVFRGAHHLSVVVPGERKAAAVQATVLGPIHTDCPASLLRTRTNSTLFLDTASAAKLPASVNRP
jgi:glucosamine-6-phosphate deaminase